MFRDDRDALYSRVASLEQQLQEAREQNTGLSQEHQAAARELKRLQRALHPSKPLTRKPRRLRAIIGAGLLLVATPLLVSFCAPLSLDLTWRAKSNEQQECRIELHFTQWLGLKANYGAIRCGNELIYETDNPGAHWYLWEALDSPGRYKYKVRNTSPGTLNLDTWAQQGSFKNLRFELEEFSEPRAGDPMSSKNKAIDTFDPVTLEATAIKVSGNTDVKQGAACTISIQPHSQLQNCRATVRCGDEVLYGGERGGTMLGYEHCAIEDRRPIKIQWSPEQHEAKAHDPAISYDLSKKELLLEESNPPFALQLHINQ